MSTRSLNRLWAPTAAHSDRVSTLVEFEEATVAFNLGDSGAFGPLDTLSDPCCERVHYAQQSYMMLTRCYPFLVLDLENRHLRSGSTALGPLPILGCSRTVPLWLLHLCSGILSLIDDNALGFLGFSSDPPQ